MPYYPRKRAVAEEHARNAIAELEAKRPEEIRPDADPTDEELADATQQARAALDRGSPGHMQRQLEELRQQIAEQNEVIAKLSRQGLAAEEVAAGVDSWAYHKRRRREVYDMVRKLRGANGKLRIFVQQNNDPDQNAPIPVTNGRVQMMVPRGLPVEVPVDLVEVLDNAELVETQREVLVDGTPMDGAGPAAYLGPGGIRPGPAGTVRRVRHRHWYPFLIVDEAFQAKLEIPPTPVAQPSAA